MKKLLFSAALLLVALALSCSTGTDISKTNKDGSPIWTTEIPKSSKLIYGIGKAKFTSKANSQDASYANACSDLAKKISMKIDSATAVYSNEASAMTKESYENIKVLTVSLTMKGVITEDRWADEDGTIWTLVSYKIKNLPELYSDAANDYIIQQEAKKEETRNKLAILLADIGDSKDADTLYRKEYAEKIANEIISEIEMATKDLNISGVESRIESDLKQEGFILED